MNRETPCDDLPGRESEPSERHRPRLGGGLVVLVAFVATVASILAVAWLWPRTDHRSVASGRLAVAVGEEIASGHEAELALDVLATDLGELGPAMDQLEFRLVEARRLEGRELRLVGGRCTSIQGHPAAQLRLLSPAGDIVTLVQTPLAADLAALPPRQLHLRGLRIDLWQEQGMLFAMVTASSV